MNECVFDRVVIIGYGQIVNNCIKKLAELKPKYNYDLLYIEYESTNFSTSVDLCKKENINYEQIEGKQELTNYLFSISEKTLLISAGNFYIFPKNIVEKNNLTIINFHSALLPKYPGRNAQTWTIFMGEKEGGATWHFVTEELDAGKYIIQKACEITEDTRAFELTGSIMDVAYEGFTEIIDGVLQDRYDKVQTVAIDPDRKVYKGKDVPGEGHFSLNDKPEYIYLLLRATDYGKSDIFPPMCTELNGQKIRISNYKKIDNDGINEMQYNEKQILIPFDSEKVLRLKYKLI